MVRSKKMRRSWVWIVVGSVLFWGCQTPPSLPLKRKARRIAKQENSFVHFVGKELKVDEKLLEKGNFEVLWKLPLSTPITRLYLLGDSLYAYSEKEKALYRIRALDGSIAWYYVIPEGMLHGPALWEYSQEEKELTKIYQPDEVAIVSRDRLILLDKKFGRAIKVIPLGDITPSTSPGIHRYNVYVCGWDNRIYAFSKKTGGEVWRFLTDGDIKVPPLVLPSYLKADVVFIASTDGKVYPLYATKGGLLAPPLHTFGEIIAPMIYLKNWIFVASTDTNLYCISSTTGRLRWRFLCEEPILRPPVALGATIFVMAEKGFLYALHYSSGKLLWQYPSTKDVVYLTNGNVLTGKVIRSSDPEDAIFLQDDTGKKHQIPLGSIREIVWGSHKVKPEESVIQILARGSKYIYALNRKREILAIDARKGLLEWRMPAGGIDFFLTNPVYATSFASSEEKERMGVIYLGFKNGWLLAIREKRY